MSEQKIFNPGNHRDAPERALRGDVVTIIGDRGWEKQIEHEESGIRAWVSNGELLEIPKDFKFVDDQAFPVKFVEEAGAVQPS